MDTEPVLGNPTLARAVAGSGNSELAQVLAWSLAVNDRVEEVVTDIPPFQWVRESLEEIRRRSDCIVVSQTPAEALVREWAAHDMADYVQVIAGQELGTKTEHIGMVMAGRYAPSRVLMIGDAPGDRRAAQDNGACFYPINPGHEVESWKQFHTEAYVRFLSGTYRGEYEQGLINRFEALLPATPPWER